MLQPALFLIAIMLSFGCGMLLNDYLSRPKMWVNKNRQPMEDEWYYKHTGHDGHKRLHTKESDREALQRAQRKNL